MGKTSAWEATLDRFAAVEMSWEPEYRSSANERMLLDYDATGEAEYPESRAFGYLYLLELSDGWIKVGQSTQWWTRRRTDVYRQVSARHVLGVVREWKTPSLARAELGRAEHLVLAYARQLSDGSYRTYPRGDGHARETEMFRGVDFDRVRAYADVIGRCDALP